MTSCAWRTLDNGCRSAPRRHDRRLSALLHPLRAARRLAGLATRPLCGDHSAARRDPPQGGLDIPADADDDAGRRGGPQEARRV
eukprot:5684355-Prymnesium_polylepis.1